MSSVTVAEAKEIAIEWVVDAVGDSPGFIGALFRGSINWMDQESEFPHTSDVDIGLMSDGTADLPKFPVFEHKGLMIEAGSRPISIYDDIEGVLADYRISPGFWRGCVAVDRTGELTEIQEKVASQFAQQKWVDLRIEHAVANSIAYADRLDESNPFAMQVLDWAFAEGVMCHVLLTGGFGNPTVRRRYSETKSLLEDFERADVQERLLAMLGSADMSVERVKYHFDRMTDAYDIAKLVKGSGFPLEHHVTEASRRISIEGTDEQIRAGDHREAVWWIVVILGRCLAMLNLSGSPDAPKVESSLREALGDLGIAGFDDLKSRTEVVRTTLDDLRVVARELSVYR